MPRPAYFLLPVLYGLFFASCQKETHPDNPLNKTADKVNTWLESQVSNGSTSLAVNIKLLKSNLDFSSMMIEPSGDEEIIVIPIGENYKEQKNIDAKAIPNLVLIINRVGSIRKGNIVLCFPEDPKVNKVLPNNFYHILNTAEPPCNGKFRFLHISGNLAYELNYEDNRLVSVGMSKARNTQSKIGQVCIDWYLITTYYDANGYETYQTEDYVGTTCYEEGGGSGGGGDNPDGGDPNAEYAIAKTIDWVVSPNPIPGEIGQIVSVDRIKGKRVNGQLQGGHFKGISHYYSACNFCNINYPYDVWEETSVTMSASGQIATCTVSGNLTYRGYGYVISNSKSWTFAEVFP